MYEMYPDAWSEKDNASFTAPGRPSVTEGGEPAVPPRRRARKEHQVAPRVLRTAR